MRGRIGYLVPEFPGQTHAFFWREATALEDAGFAVRFLTTRRPPGPPLPHAFAAAAAARTASLHPPGAAAIATLAQPAALAGALRQAARLRETPWRDRLRFPGLVLAAAALKARTAAEGVRHVHVHSFANAAHVAALARAMGGPTFSLTLHGDPAVYGVDHAAKLHGAAFATAVTRPLVAAVQAIAPGLPVHRVTMGVDTEHFTPGPARPPGGPLRLVTVARLNPTKGHAVALAALAQAVAAGVDAVWDIAGDGPARDGIAAAIAEAGLSGRVRMLGTLGEDAVLDLLRRSDVFVLPSFGLGEAAPVAVMEAMATGLAVIATRIGGTPDMIDDGTDGILVPQQDPAAIAGAIARLAAEPGLRAALGAAARRRALADFGHRAEAAKLAALLDGALTAGLQAGPA